MAQDKLLECSACEAAAHCCNTKGLVNWSLTSRPRQFLYRRRDFFPERWTRREPSGTGKKRRSKKKGQGPGRSTTVLPPRSTTQVRIRKGFFSRQAHSQDRD